MRSERLQAGLLAPSQVPAAACVLLAIVYAPTFVALWGEWMSHPYGGHGIFVPAFAAVLAWRERDALRASAGPGSRWGIALFACALAMLLVATAAESTLGQALSFLPACAGLVLALYGAAFLRKSLLPILLLALMVPVPRGIAGRLTPVLQEAVATQAVRVLSVLGVPFFQDGLHIELSAATLEVAEACNGLRFFMALLTLAIVTAAIAQRSLVAKALVVLAAAPVAFAANVARVVSIGVAVHFLGPEWAGGPRHHALGKLVWLVAVAALLAVSGTLAAADRAVSGRRRPRGPDAAGSAGALVHGKVA
jgi:exosortase